MPCNSGETIDHKRLYHRGLTKAPKGDRNRWNMIASYVTKYGQVWDPGHIKNARVTRMNDGVELMAGWDSDVEHERYLRNLSGLRRPNIPLSPNFSDGAGSRVPSPTSGKSVGNSSVTSSSEIGLSSFETIMLPYLKSISAALQSLPVIAGNLEEVLVAMKQHRGTSKSKYSNSVNILKQEGVSVAMGGKEEEDRQRSDDSHADEVSEDDDEASASDCSLNSTTKAFLLEEKLAEKRSKINDEKSAVKRKLVKPPRAPKDKKESAKDKKARLKAEKDAVEPTESLPAAEGLSMVNSEVIDGDTTMDTNEESVPQLDRNPIVNGSRVKQPSKKLSE